MKRVISNPGEAQIRDLKISKTSTNSNGYNENTAIRDMDAANRIDPTAGTSLSSTAPQSSSHFSDTPTFATNASPTHIEQIEDNITKEAEMGIASLDISERHRGKGCPLSDVVAAHDTKNNVPKTENDIGEAQTKEPVLEICGDSDEMVRQISVDSSVGTNTTTNVKAKNHPSSTSSTPVTTTIQHSSKGPSEAARTREYGSNTQNANLAGPADTENRKIPCSTANHKVNVNPSVIQEITNEAHSSKSPPSKASTQSPASIPKRGGSESTVGSSESRANQWGWFDDAHVHEEDGSGMNMLGMSQHTHTASAGPATIMTSALLASQLSGSPHPTIDEDRDEGQDDDYVVGGGAYSCETIGEINTEVRSSAHGDAAGGNNRNSRKGNSVGETQERKKKGNLLFDPLLDEDLNPVKVAQKQTSMAVTAPIYVLEESKSSQNLWKNTAGTRPPQPIDERAFFERIWAQNFSESQVDYQIPSDVLTATSPVSLSPFADGNFDQVQIQSNTYNIDVGVLGGGSVLGGGNRNAAPTDADAEASAVSNMVNAAASNKMAGGGFYGGSSSGNSRSKNLQLLGPYEHHHTRVNKKVKNDGTDDELTVVVRGDNVFGTTVSKSFPTENRLGAQSGSVLTVSISVASYRVVESKKHGNYAQFLIIYCEGTFRDTVGVWKRYSDFDKLSRWVTKGHESCSSAFAGMNPLAITEDPHDHEMLPNAVTSWKLLKKRQKWFRCLDAGYLSLKVFLLERFLHDILFESSTPDILRDFVMRE